MAVDLEIQRSSSVSCNPTGRGARCIIVLSAAVFLLCIFLNSCITDAPIKNDARQNLQSAYNITQWGVFSKSSSLERPSPDNYREPLPPFITAVFISLLGERACLKGDCTEFGFNTRGIKRINILWAFLVLFAGAALGYRITESTFWTVLALVLIVVCFLRNPAYIDSLYTEIPAAAFMLMAALCLSIILLSSGKYPYFLAGMALGCLVLTKAIFFYILPPLLVCTVFFATITRKETGGKHCMRNLLLLCFGILIIVGPWIVRNSVHFGSMQISSRGGLALYTRALINQMDPYEYRASFHWWGPGAYRRLVHNTSLDIKAREYERGGRAARLNAAEGSSFIQDDITAEKDGRPEDVISFFRTARAQLVKARMDMRQAGNKHIGQAADAQLRDIALESIVRNPFRHIITTIPLAWRGMWCFFGGGLFTILCAIAYGSFVFVCCYGIVRKRWNVLAFVTIPFFLVLYNAFLTNNLPRFNAPSIPFMVISMVFTMQLAVQRVNRHVKMRGRDHEG